MDDYSVELIKSVASDETSRFFEEYAISGLDGFINQIINNNVTDNVPIIKTIVGLSKGVISIRDRNYLKKIFKFLFQTNKVSEETKTKFKDKLKSKPKEVNKAGEAVWEILDSISSSEKAPMIGKVFEAYMNDDITVDQLIYLSEMIDKAYLYDLMSIEQGKIQNRINLINVGVYEPVNYKQVIDDDYAITSKGLTPNSHHMQNTPLTTEGRLLVSILTMATKK